MSRQDKRNYDAALERLRAEAALLQSRPAPKFTWQDAFAVVGVLLAIAALRSDDTRIVVGCFVASAVLICLSIKSHKEWGRARYFVAISAIAVFSWLAWLPLLDMIHHIPSPEQAELGQIDRRLREIEKNTFGSQPVVSAAQMEEIKQLDDMLVSRDENGLRKDFGFPEMMNHNIRMDINNLMRFKEAGIRPGSLPAGDVLLDSTFSKGRIRRYGGGFVIDPDPTTIFLVWLPPEYSQNKAKLLKFEESSDLPAPITASVKKFDEAVSTNASSLIASLGNAMQKDQNYFLNYDDPAFPQYFHVLDSMWLDKFIQLRPEADGVRDAIRNFLQIT